MKEIFAYEKSSGSDVQGLFLAGPSPRDKKQVNWRPEALGYLAEQGFDGEVYIPLPRDGKWAEDYSDQIEWELEYLERADVIAFWVPRHSANLPGFTTNVEFGLFVKSGKIVLGYPPEAHRMRYLHYLADKYGVAVHDTLKETLGATIALLKKKGGS